MKLLLKYFSILCMILLSFKSYATHLQAGQITLTRLDPISLTYKITLIVYRDKVNLFGNGPTAELANEATIVIYNNNNQEQARLTAPLTNLIDLNTDVQQGTYVVNYTFAGAGSFKIAFSESFRNGCVINMASSDQTDLYVESLLVINSFLGVNNSPVLLAAPVDYAGLGQKFLHNPAAYDPDGDSLAFKLVTPQSGLNTNVRNYRELTNFLGPAEGGGAGSFGINAVQGTLTWNTPNTIGCFNVAIKVEEWRKNTAGRYIFLGYVIRDMQIIVRNSNNRRPILNVPNNLCVAANTNIASQITASDPDLHCIRFEATGQMFDNNSPAPRAFLSYSGGNYTNQCIASPATITFNWTPSCDYIRQRPYQVVFKATDGPPPVAGPSLVDIKVWEITVVGPKPENLQANADNTNDVINLTWNPYSCATKAREIIIWRKDGCPSNNPAVCDVGAPDGQGYYEIGRVPANATAFTDRTARIGAVYSYRISAIFPAPQGGESYASDEVCVALAIDVPLFTKVDVTETSTTTGKVRVEFIQPFEFPLGKPADPFGYKVYRAEGINPANRVGNYTEVFSLLNKNSNDTDIIGFTDNNLNTQDKQYHYRIAFYSNATSEGSKQFVDSSDAASTVRLDIEFVSSCLRLLWKYDVPWGNRGFTHDIYRSTNNPSSFADIGDYFVSFQSSGIFDDSNVLQQTNYFYYTQTKGWYFNNAISVKYPSLAVPLVNNSQINSSTPRDVIKPCPPILSVEPIDCNNFNQVEPYTNRLSWINDPDGDIAPSTCGNIGDGCEFEPNNIAFFKIYYKPTLQAQYTEIGQVAGNVFTFEHTGLASLAGCYAVAAVDKAGNEGDFSKEVCVDNCISFLLPNVFTPNGDGVNDVFKPFEPVRFIEKMEFEVYNRWGKRVFSKDSDIRINWAGNITDAVAESTGSALPSGTYYYVARVRFFRLDASQSEQIYKGWVQIMR
jgi:gliding motility-associated-like protein